MGAWGPDILQNDTSADIFTEFKDNYNKGLAVKDIRILLEKEYDPDNDFEGYGEIWTAIAHGQWMCGDLENYTIEKVKEAVTEQYLTLWSEDPKLLKQRINAIQKFIEKIQTPREKPLKRKKIIVRNAYFKKGDIIGIKIYQNDYLVALVTSDNEHGIGSNRILFTDLLFKEIPRIDEVLNANILYLDLGGKYKHHKGYFRGVFYAKNMSKRISNTFKIAEVEKNEYLWLGIGTPFGNWNDIPELYTEQVEFLNVNNSEKPFPVTICDIIRPNKTLGDKLIAWDKKLMMEKHEWRRQNDT